MRIITYMIIGMMLMSCSPSEGAIQTAVAQTLTAFPTATKTCTATPTNTATKTVTITKTYTSTVELASVNDFVYLNYLRRALLSSNLVNHNTDLLKDSASDSKPEEFIKHANEILDQINSVKSEYEKVDAPNRYKTLDNYVLFQLDSQSEIIKMFLELLENPTDATADKAKEAINKANEYVDKIQNEILRLNIDFANLDYDQTPTPEYTATITETSLPPTKTTDITRSDKGPGNYLVGSEISPGVWRNNGTSDKCYWEITNEKGDIITNYFGMGKGTMYVPKNAFQVGLDKECGIWTFLK